MRWVLMKGWGSGLNEIYAALDELGEGFALEKTCLKQGKVDELGDEGALLRFLIGLYSLDETDK